MTNEDVLNSIPHLPSRQTPASLVIRVRTSPHFAQTNMSWKEETASCRFSATLGGDSFTSVRLQDKNSGATDSGRPLLLALWPISCHSRWSIRTHFSTNVIFANIWGPRYSRYTYCYKLTYDIIDVGVQLSLLHSMHGPWCCYLATLVYTLYSSRLYCTRCVECAWWVES